MEDAKMIDGTSICEYCFHPLAYQKCRLCYTESNQVIEGIMQWINKLKEMFYVISHQSKDNEVKTCGSEAEGFLNKLLSIKDSYNKAKSRKTRYLKEGYFSQLKNFEMMVANSDCFKEYSRIVCLNKMFGGSPPTCTRYDDKYASLSLKYDKLRGKYRELKLKNKELNAEVERLTVKCKLL